MTAHYRFGARTGGMGLIIGSELLAAGFVTLAIGTIAGATGNIFAATLTGFMILLLTKLKTGHAVCLVKH